MGMKALRKWTQLVKFWNEMRRTSRGGRHREARGSISTANYGKKNGGTIGGLGGQEFVVGLTLVVNSDLVGH
jgi:hypothetical protein